MRQTQSKSNILKQNCTCFELFDNFYRVVLILFCIIKPAAFHGHMQEMKNDRD